MTAELRQELLARVKRALAACQTADEAKKYFAETPEGGQAHNMAFLRWVELAEAELPDKIASCKTIAEAEALYRSSPPWPPVRDAYENHWMELLFPE
jgi:hypothetical protein